MADNLFRYLEENSFSESIFFCGEDEFDESTVYEFMHESYLDPQSLKPTEKVYDPKSDGMILTHLTNGNVAMLYCNSSLCDIPNMVLELYENGKEVIREISYMIGNTMYNCLLPSDREH